MPTISAFYGLIIQMYFREHAPPHFHVKYGDYKAVVDIRRLQLTDGQLPRRAANLVLDWAELHQQELLKKTEIYASPCKTPNLSPHWSKSARRSTQCL